MQQHSTPYLGVGINYRNEIADEILTHIDKIDFIEVNTERFFAPSQNHKLQEILQNIPVVLHGLTLSVGEKGPVSPSYLASLQHVLREVDCEWFSEHLSLSRISDIELRTLMPVAFNAGMIKKIANKIKMIMKLSDKPFLIENITYYYRLPESNMSEIDFINKILSITNCGLLLDLNNLYVNSINHSYDPYNFINQLPLDQIREVHLAGCDYIKGMLVDTHASSIKPEVFNLLKYLCQLTRIKAVVIERDDRLTDFHELLEEVIEVRKIIHTS